MTEDRSTPRLLKLYRETIVPEWKENRKISSPLAVPTLEKITLNMGVGEALNDRKVIQNALSDMRQISGQQPVVTRARQSIAGFKIREGFPVGCKVTLRRARMWDFLDRLITIALPRVRDFRGLSPRSFDGCGNYSLGLSEQIVFHEIDYDKIDVLRGLDVCLTTNAVREGDARDLLTRLGLPIRGS